MTLPCKKVTGAKMSLNGTYPIAATHGDIIRSLLEVGYRSRKRATQKVAVGARACFLPWRPAAWTTC